MYFSVTCMKPAEGRIYTDRFAFEDYDSLEHIRSVVRDYCTEAVELGWDVIAHDQDGRIIFTHK